MVEGEYRALLIGWGSSLASPIIWDGLALLSVLLRWKCD